MTILTPIALKVLEHRYLLRDDNNKIIEDPEGMFMRVAKAVSKGNTEKKEKYFNMISNLDFLPNSPVLMNSGTDIGMLFACFFIPIPDSIIGIMEAAKTQALIQKVGGGTGFSLSRLRPQGDIVKKTHGLSSGPLSFLKILDITTETIKQGGKRRGANIAVLRVDHPSILDFISCKHNKDAFNNFNISVAITDSFVEAMKAGKTYKIINPRTKSAVAEYDAQEIFHKIAEEAWLTGDPGVIFIDRINDTELRPLGEIEGVNPCSEQPLLPFESCVLGSINLANMVNRKGELKFDHLIDTVKNAVDFLDSTIDINVFPTKLIESATLKTRKIGLGVMGWADMLIQMGQSYDSPRAIAIAEEVMYTIQKTALSRSEEIALEYGPFESYNNDLFPNMKPRRNATVTTIAPTGTISIIAGCSSGIEPYFALAYKRKNILDGGEFSEFNKYLLKCMKDIGWCDYPDLKEKIEEVGHLPDLGPIHKAIQNQYKTAHEIPIEQHIKMQAAFQKYVCNATSKTINLPNTATVDDVKKAYLMAYDCDCKGVTIYRDQSRDEQVLVKGTKNQMPIKIDKNEQNHKTIEPKCVTMVYENPQKRPSRLSGLTEKIETSCGTLYVTINWDKSGKPFEIFTRIDKAGGCASSQSEAIGRLISMAMRSGIQPEHIVKQLRGITCHLPKGIGKKKVSSCADAAAQVIESVFVKEPGKNTIFIRGACPNCQGPIEHEGGCSICKMCGYSDCG